MSYLILAITLLAIFHFIYDGIIAPSLRLEARYELFALRDQLRELKKERGNHLADKHFTHLQDTINTMLANLAQFDVGTIYLIEQEFKRDKDLKKRIDARIRVMDDCTDPDAREIRKKALWIGGKATAVNSGAWFLYLLPIASVAISLSAIKTRVKAALSLTENDLKRVVPNHTASDGAAYT